VIQGGHNVPEADIRRRFDAGLKNFHSVYKQIADSWTLYDNSGTVPVVMTRGER
jgi:predicted ABC-type ATPase